MKILLIIVVIFTILYATLMWINNIMVQTMFVPACMFLYHAIPGIEAENYCNELCKTENGEKYARIFYMMYKFGFDAYYDEHGKKLLDYAANHPDSLKRCIKLFNIEEQEIPKR